MKVAESEAFESVVCLRFLPLVFHTQIKLSVRFKAWTKKRIY